MKKIIKCLLPLLISPNLVACNNYSKYIVACMGDSITYGTRPDAGGAQMEKPYPTLLKETLNFKEVFNYGIPGSTVSNGERSYEPMINRMKSMDKSANIVIFWGGGNDLARDCELGNEGDKNATTLYGALYSVCETLKQDYSNAFCMFITPLPYKYDTGYYHVVRDAIVYTADKFHIPYLDMFNDDSFKEEWNESFTDGIHPSQKYVAEKLTPKIAAFLKKHLK